MRNSSRFLTATAVALLALTPASATHSWGGYHWAKGSGELTVAVGDNVDANWDSYLQVAVNGGGGHGANAIRGWNTSSVIQSPLVAGTTNPRNCRAVAGTIQVCNSSYGNTGWLGVASIWLSGGHIAQGTTKLNDFYFNTATYNTPAWRRLVTCQEIGHDYGLDHQDVAFDNYNLGTCMDYTRAPAGGVVNGFDYGPSNEYPNDHDYDELTTIYNHVDTSAASASLAARAFANSSDLGDTPAGWGRATKRDRIGRPIEFVKDLGAGNRVLTHVFWALNEGPRR